MKNDKSASLPKSIAIKKLTNSTVVHSLTQKSKILYHKAGRSMDIARSKSISHFAPNLAPTMTKPTSISAVQQRQPDIPKSAKVIKEEAIAAAFKKLSEEQTEKKSIFKRYSKFVNIFSVSIVLLAIAGYLVYFNMPSISVRIASAQAGINATYPEYHPDGYSLNGPVSYSDGEVAIKFHANAGESEFIIRQSKSSWDSTAVKNMVDKDSKGEFIATEEKGLTIYTYNGNAAWVNGGILYTITGNAPLSSDQIIHIASSL